MSECFAHHLLQTAEVPPTEWAFLATHLRARTLAKHEAWLPAGQVARHLAFVETGVLRSYLTTAAREITNRCGLPIAT